MAKHVYRGSQSLLDVQGEENTPAAKDQELVATLSVESEQQEEQQEQKLAALLTVEETRQTDEEQQRLVALLDVQENRSEDTRTQEVIALLDVLDEVPPIPVNPPQGLQAELSLIYLYNPDAANSLIQELNLTIEEVNDAVQDITQLTVDAMKIKPYSLLGEPIAQNTPCTFDGCIYVAVATIAQKDPVFNPAQWAKVGTADYNKLYNKPDFITRSDLSCTATGLTYSQETGVLSLTSGYVIPTVAKISQIDTGIATNATNLTLETQQREEAVSNANARINALETGLTAETTDRVAADSSMANNISSLNGRLVAHETNHNNPHQVTKAQIGLGNVNNTADLDKPISTATQQALNVLSGRIGTADAKFDDYRTAAQQDILDNQIRVEISNVSQAVTLEEAARLSADATINNKINSIEEVIPSSATASNMLADRAFVNSSINNMAAYYITASASGNAFGDHARLISGPWYFQGELRTPTMNDYALVIEDETHDNKSARYLYDGAQWAFQYTLNNTEFTQDQINAIDSTITKGKVDDYDAHIIDYSNPHNVTKAQVGLSNVDNTSDLNKPVSTATQQALAQKQDIINDLATIRAGAALGATAVQPADLTAYETTAHASATYQLKGDYATTSAMNVALAGKQNVLTAGTGVTIENDVISVTFPSTIAWGNITGNINNQTDLKNALNYKQDKLTAGTNITIDENNVISATGGSELPDQTGNAGKFLVTNGTSASWGTTLTETLYLTGDNTQEKIIFNDGNNSSHNIICRVTSTGGLLFGYRNGGTFRQEFCFDWLYKSFHPINWQSGSIVTLGTSNYKWSNVYTKKINNGADIEIPTYTGTMVVANPTGATQGQVLTLDSNLKPAWADASGGGSGLNVGDIFFTMRNDSGLNGAVECNGATYNTTDFTGAQSIGALLVAGKIPYVSLADYATALATNGVCGVFGWDGVGTTEFRVPSLTDIFVEAGTAAQIGDYLPAGLPDLSGSVDVGMFGNPNGTGVFTGASASYNWPLRGTYTAGYGGNVPFNASNGNSVYGNSTTVQPNAVRYRAMVQLAVSTTDQALEICTGVLADVATLKGYDYVVEFQAPTAQNNYTWYRKYKSGWVEQGGYTSMADAVATIALPITMSDTNYVLFVFQEKNSDGQNVPGITAKTISGFSVNASGTANGSWQVSGMAAQ